MPYLISNSLSRPADILLPTLSRGHPAALDVHVISPLQQQIMGKSDFTPGHALQVGMHRKLTSHLSACRSAGVDFIPIVAEALEGLAWDAIATIKSIGKAISLRVGPQVYTSCTKQLFHCVAIALWQGNACLWLHSLLTLPPLVDGLVQFSCILTIFLFHFLCS